MANYLSSADLLQQSGGGIGYDPRMIDRKTGAPVGVRAAVGAAHTAKDKLATLRKSYPDAMPFGDDNFIFTDPETGVPTLYNEEGTSVAGIFNMPSIGDLVSAGPEAAEAVGGTIGGAGGGALGAGAAGVGAVPGALAGAAAGSAAGQQAYDWFARNVLGTEDTRSAGEHVADAATSAAMGAVGEGAGQLLARGGKAVLSGLRGEAAQNLADFERQGIQPTLGMLTDSPGIQKFENAMESTPFVQSPVLSAQRRASEQAAEASANRARGITGQTMTGPEAGAVVQRGAEAAGERYATVRNAMDDRLLGEVGADRPVRIDNAMDLYETLTTQLRRAPEGLARRLGTARDELAGVLRDAARHAGVNVDELPRNIEEWPIEAWNQTVDNGRLPFDVLRNIRTSLGDLLEAPDLTGMRATGKAALTRAYDALRSDIHTAADTVSPRAGRLQRQLDTLTTAYRGGDNPKASIHAALQRVTDMETPDAAWKAVRSWAVGDATKFQRVVGRLTRDERNHLASAILGDLGNAKPGAQNAVGDAFSPDEWLTNWNKLQDGTKDMLFGRGTQLREQLDSFARVSHRIKASGRFRNRSNTGNSVLWGKFLGWLGGLGSAGAAGGALLGPGAVAGLGAGGALAGLGYGFGRLMTSPRFVRALVRFANTPVSQAATGAQLGQRFIRQLATQDWVGDPAEEWVNQQLHQMRGAPQAGGQ